MIRYNIRSEFEPNKRKTPELQHLTSMVIVGTVFVLDTEDRGTAAALRVYRDKQFKDAWFNYNKYKPIISAKWKEYFELFQHTTKVTDTIEASYDIFEKWG